MTNVITKPETELALELEGTWEEILAHAPELAGRRLRVLVLPELMPQVDATIHGSGENPAVLSQNALALETIQRWQKTSLTQEEIAVLNEMEEFTNVRRFNLRRDQTKP